MEAGSLPPRWGAYALRLPSSLDDLRGPAAGEVELPLHVAWSGRRVYDVGQEDQRLVLYALLLAEAPREDLERFVHRESLVSIAINQLDPAEIADLRRWVTGWYDDLARRLAAELADEFPDDL